ncbi:MAG: hypothetical protein K6T86_00820 [Pirellulales bacterium]|nr:hypothetical protein [Pirellulales bacterium]
MQAAEDPRPQARRAPPASRLLLDIGGEGRYRGAWNLNPRRWRTCGPLRGHPIPNWLPGRAECIPLPAGSVQTIIVERTPLRPAALWEIRRVAAPGARVLLRHAWCPGSEPHRLAREILGPPLHVSLRVMTMLVIQQSVFRLP